MIKTCKQCRKRFKVFPSRAKARRVITCSSTCRKRFETTRPVADRFFRMVRKTKRGCWIWLGNKNKAGYGKITVQGKAIYAHRKAWELKHGKIPRNKKVLHDCPAGDNPSCVNPSHLWLGTTLQNSRDAVAKGQMAVGDKHGRSVLTKREVIAIKRLLNRKVMHRKIAAQFGVSKSAITHINRGVTWAHVIVPARRTNRVV